MRLARVAWLVTGAGAVALAAAFTPALSAPGAPPRAKPRISLSVRNDLGTFTPANGDARLAAVLARTGLATSGFRFTPATASIRLNRSVTVAVRAPSYGTAAIGTRAALVATPAAGTASPLTPIAYNLGVAVGWRRFAVSGDVARVEQGALGGREAIDVGVSYQARSFSTKLTLAADRPSPGTPRALTNGGNGYSVDVGGAYRITRNIDLTAGVRYRSANERDRLAPLADNRRDSQSVYIGTAFKF